MGEEVAHESVLWFKIYFGEAGSRQQAGTEEGIKCNSLYSIFQLHRKSTNRTYSSSLEVRHQTLGNKPEHYIILYPMDEK